MPALRCPCQQAEHDEQPLEGEPEDHAQTEGGQRVNYRVVQAKADREPDRGGHE